MAAYTLVIFQYFLLNAWPAPGNTAEKKAAFEGSKGSNSSNEKSDFWEKILDKKISDEIEKKFYNEMKELNYL